MKRPTIREIARLAKVSPMTVSLALRKDSSISESTRARIQAIADKAGYRRELAFSSLLAYRPGAKQSSLQGTLAWVVADAQPGSLTLDHQYGDYFLGAKQRCEEVGYQLEEFYLADLKVDAATFSKLLIAKDIQGLLFPPFRQNQEASLIQWQNFSSVSIGYGLKEPALSVITNAQFRSGRLALRKLRSLGYRRVGFVCPPELNEASREAFIAAYMVEQIRSLPGKKIPVILSSEWDGRDGIQAWCQKYRPDAIIALDAKRFQAEQKGFGIASLALPEETSGLAGIQQNDRLIGRTAVDYVIAMIHRGERGIPEVPRQILVEGKWIDGPSVPRIIG